MRCAAVAEIEAAIETGEEIEYELARSSSY
jgi:hypothetical protein